MSNDQQAVRRFTLDENYSELMEDGAAWYRATDFDKLAARLAEAEGREKRLADYARHLEWCADCSENGISTCSDGYALQKSAGMSRD